MKIYIISTSNSDFHNVEIRKIFSKKEDADKYYHFLSFAYDYRCNVLYGEYEIDNWSENEHYYEAVGHFKNKKLYDFGLVPICFNEKKPVMTFCKDGFYRDAFIIRLVIKPKSREKDKNFIIRAKKELRKAHIKLTGQVQDNETVCCRK